MLSKSVDSIRSRFPINTMVAAGPLAEELFCDEFKVKTPLACGVGPFWQKYAQHNAFIIGLGTDLTHKVNLHSRFRGRL